MADSATGSVRNRTTQLLTVTSTSSATSTAFTAGTRIVRISPSKACHYLVGAAPTATTSDAYIAGGAIELVCVNPGEKLAAIRTTTSGIMTVTEVS